MAATAAALRPISSASKARQRRGDRFLLKSLGNGSMRGKEFGIGRSYLDRDPPHVAPIDGKEYASRRGAKPQQSESDVKKRNRLAVRENHSVAKTARKPRSFEPGPIRERVLIARLWLRSNAVRLPTTGSMSVALAHRTREARKRGALRSAGHRARPAWWCGRHSLNLP